MNRMLLLSVCLALVPTLAAAQPWSDNFDSYPIGGLIGNGGWAGWNDNPAADALVTNQVARSAPNSVEILPTSDVVQEFSGATSGQWVIGGYNYIPTGGSGVQFFILLNTYSPNGTQNWSLDLGFDQSAGVVFDFDDPGSPTLPIIYNQWVEVRVEIDLDANLQAVFYDGQLLTQKSWTEGASGGGAVNIDTLDLFSNNGSTIWWDDLYLMMEGTTPVEPTSWGHIKSVFK
jgi:hypothetical protein